MAFRRWKKASKKVHRKKWAVKKARKTFAKKGRSQKSNIATSTETLDLGTFNVATDTGSTACNFSQINLGQFTRSAGVALNYRFYRITKVTYDYMPEANTFQAGTGTAESIPRFISVMCRDGNFNGTTITTAGVIADLEEMGGKFRPFLKPIKISYAPNICLVVAGMGASQVNTASYATRKKSPWLSTFTLESGGGPTSGGTWNHFGHQWAVVADQFGSGAVAGRLKVTAHFEFKLPLSVPPTV